MGTEAQAGLPAPVTTERRVTLPSFVLYERIDRTLVGTLYGHVSWVLNPELVGARFLASVRERVLGVTEEGEEVDHWRVALISPADTEEEAREALRDYMDSLMLA